MIDRSRERIIRVIGHKNPDTDSVCAAIAYAYLKNRIGEGPCEPRRAGDLSRETQFVLDHFLIMPPRLSSDMSPTILNVDFRDEPGIDGEMSARAVWLRMTERDADTLCITDGSGILRGVITVKDLARANMNSFDRTVLSDAGTLYKNLIETLDGTMLAGDPDARITCGSIRIGTSPDTIADAVEKGDLVLLGKRKDDQLSAVRSGAGCIIVCADGDIPNAVLSEAEERGCAVIRTPFDTYASARLVNTAAPVRHFMKTENMLTFHVNTPVDEARKTMASTRVHYFPILDKEGIYQGMVSRRNLMNLQRKKVILVDHNEKTQAVDGLEEADILEIIDHHRIGTLETGGPVYFRNEPVGCTSTIIWSMFREHEVEIPPDIAGLLLSAILSDTLLFHSPTCTMIDRAAADDLAQIAGEDIEQYGQAMFEAGEDLTGRTPESLLAADYKEFVIGSRSIAVGQGFFVSERSLREAGEMIRKALPKALRSSGADMVFYMLTSVPKQDTTLYYCGKEAAGIIADAFSVKPENGRVLLPGIVSRKQQLIPPIREQLLK